MHLGTILGKTNSTTRSIFCFSAPTLKQHTPTETPLCFGSVLKLLPIYFLSTFESIGIKTTTSSQPKQNCTANGTDTHTHTDPSDEETAREKSLVAFRRNGTPEVPMQPSHVGTCLLNIFTLMTITSFLSFGPHLSRARLVVLSHTDRPFFFLVRRRLAKQKSGVGKKISPNAREVPYFLLSS